MNQHIFVHINRTLCTLFKCNNIALKIGCVYIPECCQSSDKQLWIPIFNSWHLPFLNVCYSPYKKKETLESSLNWLLSNWSRLLNWKTPGPSSPNCSRDFWKLLSMFISIKWQSVMTKWVVDIFKKDIFKMHCFFY